MMYGKNKDTLSYSAISLWERSKEQYRERYYEKAPFIETPEMVFGKKIAKLLEDGAIKGHPVLSSVPRYSHPEHKILEEFDGVKVIGYMDSFDPQNLRFLEYKTGRAKADGRPRWDKVAVAKTDQLPMYSLLIKKKYGKVTNLCHLVWLETRFEKEALTFDGHELEGTGKDLILTGTIKQFDRHIYEWERDLMREKIIKIAKEIHEDYDAYQRTTKGTLPGNRTPVLG